MSLADRLKNVKINGGTKRAEPVWKGPEVDGITFSLLSRFLVCRERFRCYVVEGLKPADGFNHRLEFGNMWHICEECHAAGRVWEPLVTEYARGLAKKYFTQQAEIGNWHGICLTMFPLYVEHWATHPDVKSRTPLLEEQAFNVPYKLPSGREVKLRGKWDSVDLVNKDGIYLQENKTKSDINEVQLRRQLTFDLQTMIYMVALSYSEDIGSMPHTLKGIRYNVVKRPRQYQGKKESHDQFLERLRGIISDSPEEFFMRWKIEITPGDIDLFRQRCLDPILEQLCDWWEWVNPEYASVRNLWEGGIHWQHPFGVWNVLDEGGSSDLDEYLRSGSEVGLTRVENLFPELTEVT